MSSASHNDLASARSAYLRSAMHQPVRWMQWGLAAFERAQSEDKPILLDIGAVWCHWCHVMDRESYENPETARLINEHFIPVKVDRDERPDVDARYQAAVSAISGQGGWPLTAFLTPQGHPYFGGTYFPPLDQHGRPGMPRVLMTMAEVFQQRRGEVNESAESVLAAIEHNETFDGSAKNPGAGLVTKIIGSALQQFDTRNGGFGSQPKFPHSAAVDLLLDEAVRGGEGAQAARLAAMVTLEKMSKGGIYDHLAGGFARYSVDERWVVPHFEKMSYDNSELLKNYAHAFQSFAEPECARIARETIAWIDTCMSDRERGGFYASQDADVSLDDDGDYFTWTRTEAAAVLTPDEMRIAAPFYDIGELGDMHHNPEKNTLHIERPLADIARDAAISPDQAPDLLLSAKHKLYTARLQRPTPYIDRTLYTAWNAMMISAYLTASRSLDDPFPRDFALRSLDRLFASAWKQPHLAHVIAYGDSAESPAQSIPGTLDDYVFTAHAALDAWEATGAIHYFHAASAITEALVAGFYDTARGGFFDTSHVAPGEQRLGVLNTRRKPLQDAPTPAGNPMAALLLLRMAELTESDDLRERASATLECFAGVVEHFGLYAASYGLALRRFVLPPEQIVVVGKDEAAAALTRAALSPWRINRTVIQIPDARAELPHAHAHTLPHLAANPGSFALVCRGNSCLPPITSAESLRQALSIPGV